jgi:NADPH:quinone reductase-like Zn-dependent oxidoreductase
MCLKSRFYIVLATPVKTTLIFQAYFSSEKLSKSTMAESILKSCTSFPTSQTAVVQSTITPGILELSTRPVPVPLPGQVLIKVSCVALNNCDWKMPSRAPCPGAVNGADYSGTVVQLGEGVHSRFKIGDRVVGAQAGSNTSNPSSGAFTEYVVGNPDQIWRVPETLSWEEAVAIGCAVITSVGMALYKSRQLSGMPEKPTLKAQYVLVYGGATASGTFAIQFLKLLVQYITASH